MIFKKIIMIGVTASVMAYGSSSGIDFNDDGIDDLLVRNTESGQTYSWLMSTNGTKVSDNLVATIPLSDWNIEGTGDYNGDGVTDILVRNTTNGQTWSWLMNSDGTRASYKFIATLPVNDWEIAGSDSNFNGDSYSDIVVRHKTLGYTYIWLMASDGSRESYQYVTNITEADWQIAGTDSDFNKDGISDIVVRNRTVGYTYVWLMNTDGTRASYKYITNLPEAQWEIAGTDSDFNNDGTSDMVVRNKSTGAVYTWLMNTDGTRASYLNITNIPASDWEIAGTDSDFNKDGTSDLVVRNYKNNGTTYSWLMNTDGTRASYNVITNIPQTDWQIVGSDFDFNKDGTSDLVVRLNSTGATYSWLMNTSGARSSAMLISNIPTIDWEISGSPQLVFSSKSDIGVKEQTTFVQTLGVKNMHESVEYSVIGGTDQEKFTISHDKLIFKIAPNFSPAGDANGDNIYEVQVKAVDSAKAAAVQNKKISIVAIERPIFVSDANVDVPEYTTDVITVEATGKSEVILSKSGGADAALFDFDAVSGLLTFKTAPHHATPDDANGDNVYEVTMTATGSEASSTQSMLITVIDIPGAALNIVSAVYENKATAAMDDDNLSIYFSVEIDESSLPAAINNAFTIDGTGSIGNTSTYHYQSGWPYKLSIALDNTAVAFDENTKISIVPATLKTADGSFVEANTANNMETSYLLFTTGQTVSYNENGTEVTDNSLKDDGYYQKGIATALRYTRDNGNDTVTDTIKGLMWQDDTEARIVSKPWITQESWAAKNYYDQTGDTAKTYCADLTLGNYTDWRLPNVDELNGLTIKGKSAPSIDDTFNNASPFWYWTDTPCDECIQFSWAVDFGLGYAKADHKYKNNERLVRCVRDLP